MMTRRRKESGLDLLLALPWWFVAVLAVVGLAALQWIVPAATASNPFLKTFGQTFKPFGYLIGFVLGLIAVVNFFRQRNVVRPIFPDRAWKEASSPAQTDVPPEAVSRAWEDMVAKPSQLEQKPTAWSLEILRRIEWKRFEELSAAFYREIGLRSETIRCGADGGIDAKLFKADSPEPVAIVQCKAWNSRPVGVKPVRELRGVMAHHNILEGIFMATGDFTKEAVEFAKSNSIEMVSGTTFLGMIQKLSPHAQQRLLMVATEGEFTTPTCPSCGVKMIWRVSERSDFWGCSNYPRCKHVFHVASTK